MGDAAAGEAFPASESSEASWQRLALAVYRKIIQRYSREILAGESKTVPELKSLVNPLEPSVVSTRLMLLSSLNITNYSYTRDFPAFSQEALSFIQTLSPLHADLGVPVWLSPTEVLELGAADVFDRAVFLCSLLCGAGCLGAKIVVLELEGGVVHPVVEFEFGGRLFIHDSAPNGQIVSTSPGADEWVASFSYGGKHASRKLYEFNSQAYTQFD